MSFNIRRTVFEDEFIMRIKKAINNKKTYIDLLLLADEKESMIDKYLERGEMFILEEEGVIAECVVTKEDEGKYEIKNIAVLPIYQRKGYGKILIDYLFSYYSDCKEMYVGTGDVPSAIGFYNKCGFVESHSIKDYFVKNYDFPIYDNGIQLVDMVYLKRQK